VVAVATLVLAFVQSSVNWLLAHIAVDAIIAWYVAMLSQLKNRQVATKVAAHVVDVPREGDDQNVRIVAGG
jgi:amino acid permease